MRISTAGMFRASLGQMQELQSALARTQEQIASGKRLLAPSDDAIGAARSIELRELSSRIEQFDRNGNLAQSRLSVEEQALASAGDLLQRARELAVQASNGTQSNETRAFIATEIRQLKDQMIQIANTQDTTGRYLFSGYSDKVQPFSATADGAVYNGDEGQRFVEIAEGRRIADGDSGARVFERIPRGNGTFTTAAAAGNTGSGIIDSGAVTDPAAWSRDTYTVSFVADDAWEVTDGSGALVASGGFEPGSSIEFAGVVVSISGTPAAGDEFTVEPSRDQSVFETLDRFADALERPTTNDASRAALTNDLNSSMSDLDRAIGNLLDVRATVGSRLAAIEDQRDANEGFAITVEQTISEIEDLDYTEALTRLAEQINSLEAAQKSFVRIQSLSLFSVL
ncbi:MAG TPA: flagellar hook-associated protein FlgL [Woeseiaceae bacterium]|nr:flagellar hook-associated protein FlgL [Woeseiaceae bacterium]